jgi:hypothetical protein
VNSDFYCGYDWEEANLYCEHPCPSGLDADCPPLPNGLERRCIASAGCFYRFRSVNSTFVLSFLFDGNEHASSSGYAATASPATATADGNEAAPGGGGGESDASPDEDPGPTTTTTMMIAEEDEEALEAAIGEYLARAIGGSLRIPFKISSVSAYDMRYDRPCVHAVAVSGWHDAISGNSTSLDVTMSAIGEYIPVGDANVTDGGFTDLILSSINDDGGGAVSLVDAARASSAFFDGLSGVYAIDDDDLAEPPTSSPSSSPTRTYDQVLEIGIDADPGGSYGIVFDVRTPRGGGNTILLTGMSFVTLQGGGGMVEYEVYTKVGPWAGRLGDHGSFELVASGRVAGMGPEAYTRVLGEDTTSSAEDSNGTAVSYMGFRPVHVPGDGGARTFYVTATKRFVTEDGSPAAVLYGPPTNGTDGEYVYGLVDSNDDLEVYEGDGVLEYPWPGGGGDGDGEDDAYYRRPRGFFGSFEYDRAPCRPIANFSGWPCPYAFPQQTMATTSPDDGGTESPIRRPSDAPMMTMRPGGGDPGDSYGEARDDAIEEKDPSNSSGKITHGALPFRWIAFMLVVNKMR